MFLISIQSKHFSISEYEPLHNLTHPTTSKRLWLTSDRRISGPATRSWASSIDCRKEVLDTGYGDLRMKDSVRIRAGPGASLRLGHVRSICRPLRPQNDRWYWGHALYSRSRAYSQLSIFGARFVSKRDNPRSTEARSRRRTSGLHETLAPIRSASLQADTSAIVNAYCVWLEHQTRRISASNVTAC